ncbi:MAG: hypothetical protein RLP44_12525 [Aggregatilineales bacterium]
MSFRYIFPRLSYYRTYFMMLAIALSLLTGFATLFVLYSNVLTRDYVTTQLDNATPTDFEIVIRDSTHPIDSTLADSLQQNLGAVFQGYQSTDRTLGVTCGINYPDPFRCYQVAVIDNLETLATPIEGTFPQILPEPLTDNLDEPQLQAVVMQRPAERADVTLNELVYFGNDPDSTLPIEISGIVVPTDADDIFWALQTNVVDGISTPVGIDYRNDVVLLVTRQDFNTLIVPQYADNLVYSWRITTNPNSIEPVELAQVQAGLLRFEQDFYQSHPQGQIDNSLLSLVTRINTRIDTVMVNVTTIIIFILCVLTLQVFYLSTLILQAQTDEWTTLEERGVTKRDKLQLQLGSGIVVVLIAVLLAPIFGWIIFNVLTRLDVLLKAQSNLDSLSPKVFIWAMGAGITGLIAIIVPVWINDTTQREQSATRTQPFLTQFYVDIGIIVFGILLILRTYFVNSDNVSQSIEALITNPAILSETITNQQSKPDPLNLLGPLFIGVGLAIFCLRIFPIIDVVATFAGRRRKSVSPEIALRQQPTMKYSFILLLMFMAVIIMLVSAIALRYTNNQVLRQRAISLTGGDIRVNFLQTATNVTDLFAPFVDPATQFTPVLNLIERNPNQLSLIGINPETVAEHYPEYSDVFNAMTAENTTALNGLLLPEDAQAVSMQVNNRAEYTDPTDLQIEITIEDQLGIKERLRFSPTADPQRNVFVEYTVNLPVAIQPPWRVTEFHARTVLPASTAFDDFTQAIFIDDITAITSDGEAVLIDDFERARLVEWELPNRLPRGLVAVRLTTSPYSGEASLRIGYEVLEAENLNPQFNNIPLNSVRQTTIPIIISESLASTWGNQDNNGDELVSGLEGERTLPSGLGSIQLNYRIVAVTPHFPTLIEDEQFIIAPVNQLWRLLNRNSQPDDYYHWNQAWINTDKPESVEPFIAELPTLNQVISASETFIALRDDPLANLFQTLVYAGGCMSGVLFLLVFVFYHSITPATTQVHFSTRLRFTLREILLYILMFIGAVGVTFCVLVLILPFLAFFSAERIQMPLSTLLLLAGLSMFGLLALLTVLTSRHLSMQKNEDA